MPLTPTERSLRGQIAAHESWGRTTDRPARTANARRALEEKFLAEADGDPQRAESLRRAYYARLALKSAQVRRRRGDDRQTAVQARIGDLMAVVAMPHRESPPGEPGGHHNDRASR